MSPDPSTSLDTCDNADHGGLCVAEQVSSFFTDSDGRCYYNCDVVDIGDGSDRRNLDDFGNHCRAPVDVHARYDHARYDHNDDLRS